MEKNSLFNHHLSRAKARLNKGILTRSIQGVGMRERWYQEARSKGRKSHRDRSKSRMCWGIVQRIFIKKTYQTFTGLHRSQANPRIQLWSKTQTNSTWVMMVRRIKSSNSLLFIVLIFRKVLRTWIIRKTNKCFIWELSHRYNRDRSTGKRRISQDSRGLSEGRLGAWGSIIQLHILHLLITKQTCQWSVDNTTMTFSSKKTVISFTMSIAFPKTTSNFPHKIIYTTKNSWKNSRKKPKPRLYKREYVLWAAEKNVCMML